MYEVHLRQNGNWVVIGSIPYQPFKGDFRKTLLTQFGNLDFKQNGGIVNDDAANMLPESDEVTSIHIRLVLVNHPVYKINYLLAEHIHQTFVGEIE